MLAGAGHSDDAASRAYYAAFHAATALLVHEGLDFSKHSSVISAIHQRFVKPGRLDKDLGKSLNWLFDLRSIGDYGEVQHVPLKQADEAVVTAERFVAAVEKLLRGPSAT
jgi:uncharacterized protein (UPF0332 family)